jgi:hypothetical protein
MCDLYAQQKSQVEVRIRKDRPGVYLTFERVGQLKVAEPGEDRERVWLRFHNNTRWPIVLDMSGVPSEEYGDAELYYAVLSGRELIIRGECHVCSLNELGPGNTLIFSVPRGALGDGRAIRVRFSYAWEDQNDVAGGREATHYVFFDGSRLPPQSKK